jgi:hypothetical protein
MDALVLAASAFALFFAILSAGFAIGYLHDLRIPKHTPQARVTAILPATGILPRLEDLIADLARQTLPPRRLIVAVESQADPAYERVRSLQATTERPAIDLVVAGVSASSGQKNANILAALKALGPEDEYILLMDADIRPQTWYVASLFEAIVAGHFDLVNAYRWLTPTRPSLFATLIATLDRRIATLPRALATGLIWGGSIALSARALATLDLPSTLSGQILDDLPIGSRAPAAGLRVWARRISRAPTPLEGDARRLLAFARRQLQYLRLYRRNAWWTALVFAIADLGARFVLLASAMASVPHFSTTQAILIAVVGVDLIGAEVRLLASRRLGVIDSTAFKTLNRVFVVTILPLQLLWAAILCASFFALHIKWAHVAYTVDSTGRVLRIERDAAGGQENAKAAADCLCIEESS